MTDQTDDDEFAPPTCTTPTRYAEWLRLAQNCNKHPAAGFCGDCTPGWADKMRAIGRCNHPEIEFRRIDGEIYGVLPNPRRKAGGALVENG